MDRKIKPPDLSSQRAQHSAQGEPVSGTSGVGYKRLPPTTSQQDESAKKKPKISNNENEGDVSIIPQESDESGQHVQFVQVEPDSGTSGVGPTTFKQDQSVKEKPMKSINENEGDVSTIPQESDESAQQSAQVEPVSGTSGVGPTTFQQDQSAKEKPMKSINENDGDVSTIPQESDESAQQSAQVEPVSGTSGVGPTTFQQDQSAKKKPMKSNNENEGDVSTIPQESDESAQQSAQVEPVSGTSEVGPTTFQQDQSAKKKPMKSNNENEGDVSTIPQESDESDNPFPVHTINQGRSNYARLSLVVVDIFQQIFRQIVHGNMAPQDLSSRIRKKKKNDPFVFSKMTHEGYESLNTLTNGTYDNIDFTTLYSLMRLFSLLDKPIQGWGKPPMDADVTISDDVERLRFTRNKIAHLASVDIHLTEMNDYFSNIVHITQRIDTYLCKLPDQGFTRKVLNSQTQCMDPEMEQKHYQALKDIEDIKEKFSVENVHFHYGKTFSNLIQDVKNKAKSSVIPISLVLEDINDDKKPRILNEQKTEINSGLVNIKFKQAVSGSLIIYIDILDSNLLSTEHELGHQIYNFLCSALELTGFNMKTENVITVVLIKEEDTPFTVHAINQVKTNYARFGLVVFDIFPRILREIMDNNYKIEVLHQQIMKQNKQKCSYYGNLTPNERKSIDTLTNGTYDNIDFSLLYQFIRSFSILHHPKQGWGKPPKNTDVTISDDVERLRFVRNKIVHCIKADMGSIEMRDNFSNIETITKRIDTYFGKPDQGFTREVLNLKTHCMDPEIAQKYCQALKDIEQIKEKFSVENVHFYYGKTFSDLIRDVQNKAKSSVRQTISLFLEGINDDKTRRILNELKTEINSGLDNIEFKEAVSGSLIIYIDILDSNMLSTEHELGHQIYNFLCSALQLTGFNMKTANDITVVLIKEEDDIEVEFSIERDNWETYDEEISLRSNSKQDGNPSSIQTQENPDPQSLETMMPMKNVHERTLCSPSGDNEAMEQGSFKLSAEVSEVEEESPGENVFKEDLVERNKILKQHCQESFTKEIESWKKDKFYETAAVATILDEVRNKSFVVITGPSGMGKSTIVKMVALQLQRTDDYHILPVMCPKDIVKYLDPKIKQIYIIDDIFGKFSVNQSMINSWERVDSQILKYREDNKEFRVLGTGRLQISVSSQFRKLQGKYEITECNLLQENFLYSKEEKLKIAACHIDEETIKQLDDKILSAHDMFPLLCKMYAASESNPDVRFFFEYPLQTIKEELDKMSKQNESCFIGLALIVIYNNKLYKHLLQNRNDKKFKDVFEDVFEDLGLEKRPSMCHVLSCLKALEGNYTKEFESMITVIHDKIFDILSLYFGKRIPKTILTHGHGTFIAERFLFESVEEDCDDLKIVIPSELEYLYFNRMMEEIENNRFDNVFKNVQVHNKLYQEKFILFFSKDKHQSIIQKLLYNRWPLYLSAVKGCKLLVQFILSKKGTSGICNKQDKDGNHQDMLMDKPESGMYACSYDSDSESKGIFLRHNNPYNTDDDDECTTGEDAYRIQFENSPMVAACEGGYIDIVECLVEYGYNIDHSDTDLPKPLFSACKYGNKEVVDFLLKRNCKVDAVEKNNWSALHAACKNGNIDIVNNLLKCNSSVNLCDFNGYTPFDVACMKGHTDVVQILLDNNCDIHGSKNIHGVHAIHIACLKGYKDIVEILIKHNVDINRRGEFKGPTLALFSNLFDRSEGLTAIQYACLYGRTDIVKLLLDNNCDVLDNNGFSLALHFACLGDSVDTVDLLLRNNCNINQCHPRTNKSPLIVACEQNEDAKLLQYHIANELNIADFNHNALLYSHKNDPTDIVKLLLSNEACNVNTTDCYNRNALHYACRKGQADVVKLLLSNEACNVNTTDCYNRNALHYACRNGHADVVKLLLSNEACNVNTIDCYYRNALHYACRNGQADVVELLLKHHCNVNLNDKEMKTPLFMACESGHVDIVKMLINQYNCMMDVLDIEGNGLLHATCGTSCQDDDYEDFMESSLDENKNGRVEIIRLLLGKSCDVNVLNNEGQSVLHAACKYGNTEIVDILLRNNSNVNQCDKAKETPLFIACREGYINIVKLLIESKCEIFNHSINGQTVLHAVCSRFDRSHRNYWKVQTFTESHKDILTLLIDKECDVNKSDNNSQTPLHIASHTGNVELVEILLANNCVIDQCDDSNKTPFFLACEEGHKDVVKTLMNYNCNMDIRDKIGRSALHAVCTTYSMYPLSYITTFMHTDDRDDIAELLINKRCGVYDLDNAGHSALHAVCKLGNPGIVKLLLENKFDVDLRDKMGETPIFNACRGCDSDILKVLIECNCDVNVLNIYGLNALNTCITFNSGVISMVPRLKTKFNKVIKLLVDNDCSVNICDADGQTPLHRACSEGYADIAEIFLKRNSNINQCNKLMKTPLILAVEGGHTEVVKLLVEYKCDINICDNDGHTARDIAVENQFVDIENILLNAIENTNAHDACTE